MSGAYGMYVKDKIRIWWQTWW